MGDCSKALDFITIIQGEERTVQLRVVRSNGGSFSLSGATEIKVKLKNTDGTDLELTLTGLAVTVTDAPAGIFTFLVSEAQSALLKRGERMSFVVEISFGSVLRKVRYKQALTVEAE